MRFDLNAGIQLNFWVHFGMPMEDFTAHKMFDCLVAHDGYWWVYHLLFSTSDDGPVGFYAGISNQPHQRLLQHLKISQQGDPRPLYAAIRACNAAKDSFSMALVSVHSDKKTAQFHEKSWVGHFMTMGENVLNIQGRHLIEK